MSDHPPRSRAREASRKVLLPGYAAIVLLATMWPTPLDRGYSESIDRVLSVLHRNGVPGWFGYNELEFGANIVMFVPIGFLVALLLPRRAWWLAILLVPGFSVAIELAQASLLAERFATPIDVIANSIGGLTGIVASVVIQRLVRNCGRAVIARAQLERRAPDTSPPGAAGRP